MEEHDEIELPNIEVITITLDDNCPRIDLGTVSPYVAVTLFRQASLILESYIEEPRITWQDVELNAYYEEDD